MTKEEPGRIVETSRRGRRQAALLAVLLWPASLALATDQVIVAGSNLDYGTAAASRTVLSGFDNWAGSGREAIVPDAGTLSSLRVVVENAPDNGAGVQSVTFAVRRNGVATALSCTISEAATSCQDTVNSVAVAAGDTLDFQATPSGVPTAGHAQYSTQWVSSTTDHTLLLGGSPLTPLSYISLHGQGTYATVFPAETLFPTGGYLKRLYVSVPTAPGAGQSRIFTVVRNGVATALTCTIAGAATSCSDITNQVPFTAGDAAALQHTESGTPAAVTRVRSGVVFDPAASGSFLIATGTDMPPNATATRFSNVSSGGRWAGGNEGPLAIETERDQLAQATTVKTMIVEMDTAPDNGAGVNGYQFTLRRNGADTGLLCSIEETATSCNAVLDVAIADDDLLSLEITPVNTPTLPTGWHATFCAGGAGSCPPVKPYAYLKPITIDRSHIPGGCPGTTQTNYPMLFSSTDADLAHTTSGGSVTDVGGDDIVFRALDDATCGGAGLAPCTLDHEIENYVSTTGQLVAWVRIPSVNASTATSDTVIYVAYGNDTVTNPTENPAGVWGTDHVGVWHLAETVTDETTGGIHYDSTLPANNGTQNNNASIAGVIAGAQNFDGSSDYIPLGDNDAFSFDPNRPFSVSAWIYTNTTTRNVILAKEAGSTGPSEWDFYVRSSGQLAFILMDVRFSNRIGLETQANFPTGGWHHVVGTYNGSGTSAGMRLYVDGVQALTNDYSAGTYASMKNGTEPVLIGSYWGGGNGYDMNGRIDELRLSGAARSSCWVGASYSNQAWPDKSEAAAPTATSPSSGFYTIGAAVATAVDLLSFEARGRDGVVDVLWETGSEVNNLGFHLYRSLSESGPWERITTSLMPGLGSSPEGARYGYSDVGLANGVTYFYQLEDVETTGKTKRHGPVSAVPQAGAGTPEAEDSAASEAGEDPSAEASAWIRYGDPEATSLSVLERGERQVVVELRTGGFWAFPDEDGSVWLQIPGFDETRQVGAPALPVRQAWLEALAGRKVKLASVVGHDVVGFDGLRPAVTGSPELWEAEDGTLQAGQRRARAGRAFQAAGLFPEAAAELVGVAFQGDVKKAQLALSPLRWDRTAGRLLLARRLVVRVEFAGVEQDELALGGSHGRKQRGKPQRLSEGVVARLAVEAPGLYGVSYEDLFGRGGRGVSVSELSLSHQGEAVAFHVEPAGRRFGPGGMLYFASAGAKLNPYGRQAVYELSLGGGGVQMPLVSAAPGAWGISYYWQQLEQESNRLFIPTLLDAPDLWLWQYVLSGRTNGYTFSLSALAPASESGQLTVWLQGASDFPVDPDHHVRLSVNGLQVGEASWDGKRAQRIEAALWPGLLREGDNLLEITNVGDTGASSSLVILDRFAVSYPRRLLAQAGVLAGRIPSSGSAEVQGVGAASYVLDTSAPVPRWLSGMAATALGVSFAAEAGREYQVVSPEALLRPQLRAAAPDTLRDVTRRGEYLVVGPRAFLEAAEPLLAQRASQGLETLAVAIEDVYDAFGFGETRPEALRDFLAYAYHHWQLAPRYVLLLGDASYDFKDYSATGIGNAVPPYMIPDAYMWTVSDPAYAAVNGDDLLPDLALGRLPAQSLEQARALVQKVLAWENAGYDLSQRAVMVADNSDAGGDFEGDAERVAQSLLAGGREVERVYVSKLRGATRAAIYDSFARGASLMSYLGHGATTVWASENVLNFWDVPNLAPQPQQPFLLTMNCLNGYFHMPSQGSSLAEALVKEPERGAIGAIAASSLSVHWAARIYHEALVAELASGRHQRLGDAILAAQSTYANSGAPIELLAIYQILADPALQIR